MKTWILKNNLSRSPQAAFRLYTYNYRKPKFSSILTATSKIKQHLLVRQLKLRLKAWLRWLDLETNRKC